MNLDDFEKRLQGQRMREIPSEWRNEILSATRQATDIQPATRFTHHASRITYALSTLNHHLSTILWPSPRAWAGLAAIWVIVLAVNHSVTGGSQQIAKHLSPPSPQLILALQQTR